MTGGPGPLRWGVLGCTSMVARLAVLPAMRASASARLVAVASRDAGAARSAADSWGASRWYADYAALLDDPEVEAVYIPLPNGLHAEWTERAAAAGLHVLCEKPLAPTAGEAAAMAAACARAGVLLVEAYMTPHHPRHAALLALALGGGLGRLRRAEAVFTFTLADPANHRWRPEQGGGALLDVGVYCLAPLLALAAPAEPVRLRASARVAGSGVDATFTAGLEFSSGMTGTITCSFEAPERQHLEVVGEAATVAVDHAFTPGPGDTAMLVGHGGGRREVRHVGGDDPYRRMLEQFAAAVRGEEAPLRPASESVALLRVLDRLRAAADTHGGSVAGA